jgi:hypothetical protein
MFLMLVAGVLLGGIALADNITLHPSGSPPVTGEIISIRSDGPVLKLTDGTYSDPVPWSKLTQEDLKLLQQEPQAAQYVEPFIEVPRAEKLSKTQIDLKPVPRLERPERKSLLAAMAGSGLGFFVLLIVYAGNIYAAYEISIFRARPPGLVCGVAAVAPILGPIIFLAMPTHLQVSEREMHQAAEATLQEAIAEDQAAPMEAGRPATGTVGARPPASNFPAPKVFLRGQYTFNRRFFETQVPGFFAVIRPEADKEMTLTFKSTRGTHVAARISRISPSDIYLQVQKGHASEEVVIPFVEIQEVIYKHKDA